MDSCYAKECFHPTRKPSESCERVCLIHILWYCYAEFNNAISQINFVIILKLLF